MHDGRVSITFFLDGKSYATRFWGHVPRTGDEVMLGAGRSKPDEKMACRVVRVVWGVEPSDTVSFQCVNVAVERID